MYYKNEDEITKNWIRLGNNPLVSIICITYNHVDFIEKALCGFLSQETTFPFEVLVHDDCSSDGTKEILALYQERYPNIIRVFYENENQYKQGINGRNFIGELHSIAGKYVALCEGDDYWTDVKKLQIQADFLETNHNFVVCYHDCSVVYPDGNIVDSGWNYIDGTGKEIFNI